MTYGKCYQCGLDAPMVAGGCPSCGANRPPKTWTRVVMRRYVTMTMVPIYIIALVVLVGVVLRIGL